MVCGDAGENGFSESSSTLNSISLCLSLTLNLSLIYSLLCSTFLFPKFAARLGGLGTFIDDSSSFLVGFGLGSLLLPAIYSRKVYDL